MWLRRTAPRIWTRRARRERARLWPFLDVRRSGRARTSASPGAGSSASSRLGAALSGSLLLPSGRAHCVSSVPEPWRVSRWRRCHLFVEGTQQPRRPAPSCHPSARFLVTLAICSGR
jgi:hypothetical protein